MFYLSNEVVGCSLTTLNVYCVGNNGIENRLRTGAPCERNIIWPRSLCLWAGICEHRTSRRPWKFSQTKIGIWSWTGAVNTGCCWKWCRVGLLPEVWQASPPASWLQKDVGSSGNGDLKWSHRKVWITTEATNKASQARSDWGTVGLGDKWVLAFFNTLVTSKGETSWHSKMALW